MKAILTFLCLCCFAALAHAQVENIGDYEVKVTSYQYKTTKGHLKKINAEGVGIEDYKGNYIIFRTPDIINIKIRKRGLGFGRAVGGGAVMGLGIGAAVWSLDESGENAGDMAKLTAALTATGAVAGMVVGAVAEATRTRLTLKVNGNQEYFKKNYQKLEPYVNPAEPIQHVSR